MAVLQLLFDFIRDGTAERGARGRKQPITARKTRGVSSAKVSSRAVDGPGGARSSEVKEPLGLFIPSPRDAAPPPAAAAACAPAPAPGIPLPEASASPAIRRMPRRPRGVPETPMQRRYDAVVVEMLERHGLVVRKWRTSLSGIAIHRVYRDGREERLLESPYPTSPLRMSIFLHEVGHHAIGLGIHRPRCLEEHLAWEWSVARMRELGFATEGTVARRVQRSMEYAVAKSLKRGIRRLPVAVLPYAPDWVRAAVGARAA